MNRLDLTGLKAHHPLGFLAACGLLRCLTQTKGFGPTTKLGWCIADDDEPFAAVNYSEYPLDIGAIARMLLRVAERQRTCPAWTWSRKIDDRTRFRETSCTVVQELFDGTTTRGDADMLAAFASDLISTPEKGKEVLRHTAFDLTSGNQAFLKSLTEIAEWQDEKAVAKALAEALTGTWRYQDDSHSLGWDPQTQRLHALRWKAPTKDTRGRSVRAAVFLASLALPMFPCFAVGSKLRTTGFHRHDNGDWFAWPIWQEPISLDTLRSLLSHPFKADLKQRGVYVVYRCRVAHTGGSQGNYQVLSHPEERQLPRPVG